MVMNTWHFQNGISLQQKRQQHEDEVRQLDTIFTETSQEASIFKLFCRKMLTLRNKRKSKIKTKRKEINMTDHLNVFTKLL